MDCMLNQTFCVFLIVFSIHINKEVMIFKEYRSLKFLHFSYVTITNEDKVKILVFIPNITNEVFSMKQFIPQKAELYVQPP